MQIQGISFSQLAEQFGTPLYIYDGDKIASQVATLKSAFSKVPLKIKYATKALTNVSILKLMKNQGAGVDAVSIEEVRLCMLAGFTPGEIMYTPNCVGFEEIQEAVVLGAMINLDNLPMLAKFGQTYGQSIPVCIRINPHIMAGGNSKISVGHIHSKFGISIDQIDEILSVVRDNNMKINGLHIHAGSDIMDAEAFLQGANVLFEIAHEFPELEFLDFGGGFKVAYREGDVETDMQKLGEKVSQVFLDFCKSYGRVLDLCLEPGKFLVSEAGYFMVKANVVKNTPEITFVGVNSGLNHLIRPMMYNAHHQVENISNNNKITKKYDVVGYICETDTLASQRELGEVESGNLLVLKNAGAYGYSMASNYNSRLRPAEVLLWNGKAHLIRKREEFEDLTRNQVIIDF